MVTKNRARPAVEELETRAAAAALNFVGSANIYGAAWLDGSGRSAVKSLQSSHWGNIISRSSTVGYPASSAYSALNFSPNTYNKSLNITTSAYTTNFNRSTEAVAQTTTNSSGYTYVTVRVDRTGWERDGQRVQVTLTPSFVSTIGWANRGYAANSYSFYVNGQQYLGGTDTSKGTETFARTITFNTTIGSTFRIAFQAHSYAGATQGGVQNNYNVATNQFSLGMSVRAL